MAIRVIVSDTALGDHANTVKAAISLGYGSDISDQIEIKTGGLSADLAYADSIGAIAVVRSTTGYSSYASLAESYYPRILMFMPLGSNSNIELATALSVIVSSGAGDAENKNNTAYGDGLEFWDNDYETSVSADISSYSNGVVAGKLLKIKDTLNCGWWQARYSARKTADRTEDNRPALTEWHNLNGYGKINISNAVAFSDAIITDPYIPVIPDPVPETLNNNTMINKTFNIDLSETNECNFSFIRGDTFQLIINVKNEGDVFNLTDYTPILTAMLDETGTTPDIQLYGADVDTTKADEGTLTFTFSPSNTENETAGDYYYDIQITKDSTVYTIVKSTLELIQDVTKGTTVSRTKYKVYTAFINQTGTDAPIPTILENTTGGTIVWTRADIGNYIGTPSWAYVAKKTVAYPLVLADVVDSLFQYNKETHLFLLGSMEGGELVDNALVDFPIEIRVYN